MNIKVVIIVSLIILAFIGGFLGQYFYPNEMFPTSDIPVMLIGVFLSFMWYYLDSQEINYKRGPILNIGIVAIGFIAFPYYFFRSRGLKHGLVYTFVFIVIVLLWYLMQYSGAMLAHNVFQR